MNRDLSSDNRNHSSPKLKKSTKVSSPVQDKADEFKINSNKAIGQRPRSAGFRSFLSWFKKVENLQRHEEEVQSSESSSESSEENNSSSSTATVASFSFLPANKYKPYGEASQPEKFFSPGPYTETYHKLILERNKRRHLDKNISLRKKYSLYSSGTISSKIDRSENVSKSEQNEPTNVMYDTFSLPTFSKLKIDSLNEFNDRKTASLSSRNVKTGTHVKGKRKAPLPPISSEYIKSYRKKRKAPPPPLVMPKFSDIELTKKSNSPLTKSPLKERKSGEEKGKKLSPVQNADVSNAEISPKPWYKRESKVKHNKNSIQDIAKKKKHEFPEVGFFRCSQLFENFRSTNNDKSESENKNEKRVSRLLPNISELDREAAEIIKHHKSNIENGETDILMWKTNAINKPSSARDLISKFNALSNVQGNSKVTNNIEIRLSNNNIIRNDVLSITNQNSIENGLTKAQVINENNLSTSSSDTDNSIKNIPPQNLPREGEISKSFKAEIFSALPDLATASQNTKDPIENNIQSKSMEQTKQKLTEMEEKIRLREILKEMKNSLPKRPKTNIITENPESDQGNKKNLAVVPEINPQHSSEPTDRRANFFNIQHIQVIPQKHNETKKELNQISENFTKAPEKSAPVAKSDSKISELCKPIPLGEPSKVEVPKTETKIQNNTPIYSAASSKVSSFAQTKSVLCKSDQIYETPEKIMTKYQPPTTTALQTTSNAVYMNVEESKLLKNNPPVETKLSPINSLNTTNVLLKQLEQAITEGDDVAAAKLAKDLAMLKVNCLVMCSPNVDAKEVKWKKINIYIEDQFSQQGPLPIQIPETTNMGDLKSKVSKEFNIPIAAQRWIIGKQLADDDNALLTQYNKNNFETPLFLYVIALEKPLVEQADNKVMEKNDVPSSSKSDAPNIALNINITQVEKAVSKNVTTEQNDTKILQVNEISNLKIEDEPKPSNSTNGNPELKNVIKNTWICTECTLINSLLSPLCSACGTRKPSNAEKYRDSKVVTNVKFDDSGNHYMQLLNLDNRDIILNMEDFECPICLTNCGPQAGVTLKECLHSFCKQCLENMIKYNEDAELKCPFIDENYSCDSNIQEREIKAIGGKTLYEGHLAKSIRFAENKIQNAFHCKSPDCKGWCIFDDNVNEFICPVCRKNNCLTCQAIHEGKNCKEYQEQMNSNNIASKNEGQQTKQMLDDMVKKGEALACPSCQVILMKKWGCDWLRCSMCKTEICWVTRGPRWGPGGKGDTSAGCQCGVNGIKCHPKCNYCH